MTKDFDLKANGLVDVRNFYGKVDISGEERPEGRRGPGRTVTLVGGGLIVAVVLATFGLGFSRGGGSGIPATTATEAAQPNPSLTVQSGPGTPTVTDSCSAGLAGPNAVAPVRGMRSLSARKSVG